MSDLSTDPTMMREQQDKDTPQRIERDETVRSSDRHDSDAASARDRDAAKAASEAQDANETMDDIFEANRDATGRADPATSMAADAATDGAASLAGKDRSLLGR